ncbi:YczE/YyaS/YitT family protein [Streptococcus merionis]|uniref:YczE/YyaS/YitT family protein n=1 Tax=Streptococcus merionis TaxID=400065 RepID=UPI003515EAF4
MKREKLEVKQIVFLLFGILIVSLGTTICLKTSLGVDPFNAFSISISRLTHIGLGPVTLVLSLTVMAIIFVLDKRHIGLGSFYTMLSIGYFINFFDMLLPDIQLNLLSLFNILIFIMGMLVTCFGAAMYFEADLGLAPYDSIAFVVSKYTKKENHICRVFVDIVVALIALFLGGPISLGTIILAFGLGPFINYFRKQIQHFSS